MTETGRTTGTWADKQNRAKQTGDGHTPTQTHRHAERQRDIQRHIDTKTRLALVAVGQHNLCGKYDRAVVALMQPCANTFV